MAKFLSLILIYTAICISLAHRNHREAWLYGFIRPFITPTSICANSTTQAGYLAQTIALINNFQLNSTYNSVLQIESSNFVAYLTNPTNQALLYSNCTAFVIGVKAAKSADQQAAQTRQQIAQDIYQKFRQVPHNVTGSNGPNDLDSNGSDDSDSHEHH
ncbi:unnamed protein product [Rotaria sp. Silwood2]|nr:unnamed protein product [Rotaria sp. Silwood2]CAF3053316.1 unnamed protein product [Rotaria sp. Silwood2]CAF3186595.1 unnamed protein product [Rotaria sp. Silwood2]CAF3355377.1 unnamed protein product [Rotaria sp. Silwood2]CAF4012658.1 unnamed protein product [Rotaria sp. Silwood2]